MTDKNGKRLKVEDWVYCRMHHVNARAFVATVLSTSKGRWCYVNITPNSDKVDEWMFSSYEIEILPDNGKKRNQILFLKRLEE